MDLFIHLKVGVETHIVVFGTQLHHHLQSSIIPYMFVVCDRLSTKVKLIIMVYPSSY